MPTSMRLPTLSFLLIALFISNLPTHAAQPENFKVKTPQRKSSVVSSTQTKAKVGKGPTKVYKVVGNKVQAAPRKAKSKSTKYVTKKKSYNKVYSGRSVVVSSLPAARAQLQPKFVYPVSSPSDPKMEFTNLSKLSLTQVFLPKFPEFTSSYRGKVAALTKNREFVQFSLNADLQEYAKQVAEKVRAPHVAIVAMEPRTGRILAMAGHSVSLPNILSHAGFPAASLIKVITAAAAVEHGGATADQSIFFRGGTYELGPNNYDSKPGFDRHNMTIKEALGKSCNPVFSRVGLTYMNPALFRSQIAAFGFNSDLRSQLPVAPSIATIPNTNYEFGRTTAGFGDVFISPVHAALLVSTIANGGKMPQPTLVDQVITTDGDILFKLSPALLRQSVTPRTARTVLNMMTATTTTGTSKREFAGRVPWEVAAKTGTLKGTNPVGLNNWFIGTAPLENPRIAVAVIVVNAPPSAKASHIGRLILERFLG